MWRAAPSAIETGQNSTVTGPQALTRYAYQSVVLLFPSCSMGERPTAREAKTENRVEIFLRGNAKGENEFRTSGRLSGSYPEWHYRNRRSRERSHRICPGSMIRSTAGYSAHYVVA